MNKRRTRARVFGLLLVLAAGCSSSDENRANLVAADQGSGSRSGSGSGSGSDSGPFGNAIPGGPDAGRARSFDAGGGNVGTMGNANACASVRADAQVEPVYLAFAFDVSGSMGKGDKKWHDKSLKWDPVVKATEAFFAADGSSGLQASLTFFPEDGDEDKRCDDGAYEKPDVAMTELPSNDFADAISAIEPQSSSDWRGGTPTLFVLRGTHTFVEKQRSAHDGRYVIVLVTDGYPEGCSDDDDSVNTVAKEVAAALDDDISTYVIGVANPPITDAPDTVSDLQKLAKAGGTDHAFIIDTGDPVKTKNAFGDAIAQIRGSALSCTLKIPTPPDGRNFDKQRVRVSYTSGAGTASDLRYDASCSGDNAWHYDDPKSPSEIVLCDQACTTVQADAKAALRVEFTCDALIAVE